MLDNKCYIIAEMSANHAGDINRAIDIIYAAKESGADCIKIQTYTPDTMTIDCNNKYFTIDSGTWAGYNLYELYGKAYTPWEWQPRLKEEADKIGIDFLSTPFDKTSVDFLEDIGIDFYKIASFELVDIPLIKYIAAKNKPIIMSTGMASLGEIEEAINAIKGEGNNDISILKCTSSYPAKYEEMNLKTIPNLKDTFNVSVGLSDHSLGSTAAVVAVSLGATIIEKHFCMSRDIENPDSSFSMEPKEFKEMVRSIREAEKALGKVNYELTMNEKNNKIFRRSIFAVKDIDEGELINYNNIKIIRPGYGLKPKYYSELVGKKANTAIKRGTPISWDIIC
jgi:pseudaminic acid synthase